MKYEIIPYEGFIIHNQKKHIINISKNEDYYIENINEKPSIFTRSRYSKYITQDYSGHKLQIDFNKNGLCNAIGFFPEVPLVFKSINLFDRKYLDLKHFFLKIDPEIEMLDVGFTSFKFGIHVYAPLSEVDSDEPIEGIMIFIKGYYDKEEKEDEQTLPPNDPIRKMEIYSARK